MLDPETGQLMSTNGRPERLERLAAAMYLTSQHAQEIPWERVPESFRKQWYKNADVAVTMADAELETANKIAWQNHAQMVKLSADIERVCAAARKARDSWNDGDLYELVQVCLEG